MRHFPLRFKEPGIEKEFLSKTGPIIFRFYIVTLVILGIMCFYSTFINFRQNDRTGGILTSSFLGGIIVVVLFRNRIKKIVPFFTFGIGIAILTMNLVGISRALKPLPPVILIIYYNGFMLGMFHMLLEHLLLQFQVKVMFVMLAITLKWTLLPTSDPIILLNSTFIDLANLLIMYYYERNNRSLFKTFFDSRNELSKFRVLLTEHLPHNILILTKKLDKKLFANKFFANKFKVENLEEIKELASSFKININTVDQNANNSSDSTFCGLAEPSLLDYLNYTRNDAKDEGHITCFNIDYIDGDENKVTYEAKVFHLDWDGTPAITIMLNDLTQQQTILALKIADENKDRLLATVSHELRTPINGMLGITQIIEDEFKDPKLLSYCKSAKVCAKMLMNLVNSILDLAQIRNRCMRLNPTQFKLRDMLGEVESIFRPQCKGKNVEFLTKADKDVPSKIVSDQGRLMQVIINLLANALKFTFKGQIMLRVMTGQHQEEIEFRIEDTGTGIKEEDKPKLFKAFGKLHQTNPKINTQGVGLGLTISNSLVSLLNPKKDGNKIEFDSVYGEGTTFFFTISSKLVDNIPIEESEKSEKDTPEKVSQSGYTDSMAEYGSGENFLHPMNLKTFLSRHNLPPGFIKDYKPKDSDLKYGDLGTVLISLPAEEKGLLDEGSKIDKKTQYDSDMVNALIVDDNSLNLLIASKILQSVGFAISTAFNGQDAIKKVKDQDRASFFKLILMDCEMPIMNGLQATQILKSMMKQGEIPEVPIFALTANDSPEDHKKCIEAGMSGCLSKPLKTNELEIIIKKLGEQGKAGQDST